MQPESGSSSHHGCWVGRRLSQRTQVEASNPRASRVGKTNGLAKSISLKFKKKKNSYLESNKEIGLLTPVRMVIIKKSTNNKCWRRYGEKGIFLHCRWEWKLVQLLWKTVCRFLKKLKNRVAIWFSNATPGHSSRPNYNLKRYTHPYVHSSTIYTRQNMEVT